MEQPEQGEWLIAAYGKMTDYFGDLRWWPAETPFEVALGAILTQNTAWANVERAIERLREKDLLDPHLLFEADSAVLAEAIRPSGYYNIKTERIRAFLDYLHSKHEGSMTVMFRQETDVLRRELLSVKGIGEETADSILLYGNNRPVFVVDAYTRRILERHGIIDKDRTYGEIQNLFMESRAVSPDRYNQYHALIVHTGKHFCRKAPRCEGCPLQGLDTDVSRETS